MIASIKGKIIQKSDNFLIVENQGIGYKIFTPAEVLLSKNVGEEVALFTHQHVREDALQLFGFLKMEELSLFEKMISVSGIGPKTALGVFAVAKVEDVKSAIINQDPSILKKVSGIGAKTAERLVLELRNKVDGLVGVGGIKSSEEMEADIDSVEALVSLGFSANDAREALKKVDPSVSDSSLKVKEALKLLRR